MNSSTYLQPPSKRKLWGVAGVVVLHALLLWAIQAGLHRTVVQKLPPVVHAILLEEKRSETPPPPPKQPPPAVSKQTEPKPPLPSPNQQPLQPALMAPTEIATTAPPANVIAATTPQPPTSISTTVAAPPTVKSEPMRMGPVGIYCEKPSYPSASKRMDEEGSVTLKIFIGIDGNVFKIDIDKPSGFKRLDDAAKNESMRWRFKPATLDGKPVEHSFTRTFNFKLNTDPTPPSKEDRKSPC